MITRKHYLLIALLITACLPAYAQKQRLVRYSSGTGFFVTRDGYVVTNHHVVKNCLNTIIVSGPMAATGAKLMADDADDDLALLKIHAVAANEAKLSNGTPMLHADDQVVVVGFPGQSGLSGQVQTREAKIVTPKAPYMKGAGGDKWIAFSDSVAPGNSGGPLLDISGNVIGVIVAKGQIYEIHGNEKTAFDKFDLAIRLPVLRQFLEQNGVRYSEAYSGIYLSAGHITDDARRYIVNVRCQGK